MPEFRILEDELGKNLNALRKLKRDGHKDECLLGQFIVEYLGCKNGQGMGYDWKILINKYTHQKCRNSR